MALDIKKVRQMMQKMHILQQELAGMCGVSDAAMSRYLAGTRQPRSETLANMATALGTTSNDLLGLEPPTKAEEVFRLVARNVSAIPPDVRFRLIQLLSQPQAGDGNKDGEIA